MITHSAIKSHLLLDFTLHSPVLKENAMYNTIEAFNENKIIVILVKV